MRDARRFMMAGRYHRESVAVACRTDLASRAGHDPPAKRRWRDSSVVSAAPHADVPGSHVVRFDAADYPDVINIDSHDWILDLPADPAWSRTVAISELADTPELRALVREHVFGVPTYRRDHHHPRVPDDIAAATPKREPTE